MKRILIIEDDSLVRNGLVISLQRHGYEVLQAAVGTTGLALACAQRPDLVLSDINIPGQNGLDVLRELRARSETAAIPVILMTGEPHKADARSSMNLGADDYLQKPFSIEQMLATVSARLERQSGIERAWEARTEAERISAAETIRLQSMALEAAANGMVITDRNGMIMWMNQAFTRLTGYAAPDAVGQSMRLLNSGRQPHDFYAQMWATICAGRVWHGELVNKRKDGSWYDEEMTITPVRAENGEIQNFIAIKQDITERKLAVEELKRKSAVLEAQINSSPDGILVVDEQGRKVLQNQRFTHMLKVPAHIAEAEDDEAQLRWALSQAKDPDKMLARVRYLKCHRFEIGQDEVEFKDGTVLERYSAPVLGNNGAYYGRMWTFRDITERKRLETELFQARKLESIGQLAAGIAHEINTPTQYVGDNTRFVRDSFAAVVQVLDSHAALLAAARAGAVAPERLAQAEQLIGTSDLEYLREQIPQALAETLEGVDRVRKIVQAMKDFSHPGGREKAPADLNKAIQSTVTVARNEWKYVADLELHLDAELPYVPCFLGEFNQLVLNLVINAAHAIGDVVKTRPGTKGRIDVSTRRDGEYAELRVADTGTGIPEAARAKIFEPFFTTKGVGKGTGQGLAMVYGSVVKRHGGTVTFETEVGHGSTFIVRLPLKAKTESDPEGVKPAATT